MCGNVGNIIGGEREYFKNFETSISALSSHAHERASFSPVFHFVIKKFGVRRSYYSLKQSKVD